MSDHQLTCPQGHQFATTEHPEGEIRCPECDTIVPMEDTNSVSEPNLAGLWSVMNRTEQEPTNPESEHSADTDADQTASDSPKGLWALMNPSSKEADTNEYSSAAASAFEEPPTTESGPKSLWSVMSQTTVDETSDETSDEEKTSSKVTLPPLPDDNLQPVELDELTPTEEPAPASDTGENIQKPVRSRGAILSLLLGLVSVPTAALAMMPEFWTQFPATVIGFSAMLLGYLAMGEIRRSRGRLRGKFLAGSGLVLGILGIFAGPFVFTDLGIYIRKTWGRRQTYANLEKVGEAMNAYRRENNYFPPGSIHKTGEDGTDIALHSWQTTLLPYLGDEAAEIYSSINMQVPFNDEVNRPAMQQDIPAYYASGSSRERTANGFAVSHFVALSGHRDIEGVGRASLGVFSRNSRVHYNDVIDGLSFTLVAGEIAVDFRPWGEPDVWRTIGNGLNKGRESFGNADRTGAMFLRADGSVKFFSNSTDLEVLRKLSTRDGQEYVPNDY
ncbi:MAG: hypothetical protein Tsb009_31450 [Planctomycetaceae bacterium]